MKRSILKKSVVLLLFILVVSCLPVLAAGGDGSGGGQDEPLALAASFPADGAQGISQYAQIKLTFNKNVVNMSVRESNRRCFSLTSGGHTIPIDIIMADDQVYPEGKRDVMVKPRQALAPGTRYTVTVASGLQAKSGAVLGETVSLSFTTIGAAASAAAPNQATGAAVDQGISAAQPSSSPMDVNNSSPSGDAAAGGQGMQTAAPSQPAVSPSQAQGENQPTEAAAPTQENQSGQGPDYTFWIIIKGGLLLAVVLAYVLIRYRRK